MFERFTDRARRVVVLAQEEARMLNHNYIGTEHILLGLIHEGEGVAANFFPRQASGMPRVARACVRGLRYCGAHRSLFRTHHVQRRDTIRFLPATGAF